MKVFMGIIRMIWWMSTGVFALMAGILVSPDLMFTITDAYDPPTWVPNVLFLWWYFWVLSLWGVCSLFGLRELRRIFNEPTTA